MVWRVAAPSLAPPPVRREREKIHVLPPRLLAGEGLGGQGRPGDGLHVHRSFGLARRAVG